MNIISYDSYRDGIFIPDDYIVTNQDFETWRDGQNISFNTGPTPVLPDIPQNFLASDGEYLEYIKLTWDISDNAIEYDIYRATSSEGEKELIHTTSLLEYDDSDVDVAIVYYYWVKAKNEVGESDFSILDAGYRQEETAEGPSAPTNLQASDGTSYVYVTLNWTASENAMTYEVYRSTFPLGVKALLGTTFFTNYQDIHVVPGTVYYYWVKARNPWGVSEYSDYDSGYRKVEPEPVIIPVGRKLVYGAFSKLEGIPLQ